MLHVAVSIIETNEGSSRKFAKFVKESFIMYLTQKEVEEGQKGYETFL